MGKAVRDLQLPFTIATWVRDLSEKAAKNVVVWLGMLTSLRTLVSPAQAQVRGVYPSGMSATNSGVTPEPGFTYSNLFLFYSRDQLKGPSSPWY